jgi:hypothetical protein
MARAVDSALLATLEGAALDFFGYFASNAGLVGDSKAELEQSLRRRKSAIPEPIGGFSLELRLRALIELCRKSKNEMPSESVIRIVEILEPLISEAETQNERLRHLTS